jgi:hypothetical protein
MLLVLDEDAGQFGHFSHAEPRRANAAILPLIEGKLPPAERGLWLEGAGGIFKTYTIIEKRYFLVLPPKA